MCPRYTAHARRWLGRVGSVTEHPPASITSHVPTWGAPPRRHAASIVNTKTRSNGLQKNSGGKTKRLQCWSYTLDIVVKIQQFCSALSFFLKKLQTVWYQIFLLLRSSSRQLLPKKQTNKILEVILIRTPGFGPPPLDFLGQRDFCFALLNKISEKHSLNHPVALWDEDDEYKTLWDTNPHLFTRHNFFSFFFFFASLNKLTSNTHCVVVKYLNVLHKAICHPYDCGRKGSNRVVSGSLVFAMMWTEHRTKSFVFFFFLFYAHTKTQRA